LWSLPGGRVEPGESDAVALVREIREECGLEIVPGKLAGQVLRPAGRGPAWDGAMFDIRDYRATVTGGSLRAGDDAADARWVTAQELGALPLTDGLLDTLTEWGIV